MKKIIYKAESRGHAIHGWLDTWHTFSFADYYNPDRMHFGTLRVLNDDYVKGGEGFGTHPHDNMEIVTIPIQGSLRHGDSMGNTEIIHTGEVQVMSAGTGILHSEFNAEANQTVNFFQIWIFPDKKNVTPQYATKNADYLTAKNQLQVIVSPCSEDTELWINQSAWLSIGTFEQNFKTNYSPKRNGNGVFLMVMEGSFEIEDEPLNRRDAIGIWDTNNIRIKSINNDSRLLVIDVPMLNK